MLQEFITYLGVQVKRPSIYVLGSQGQHGNQITESWIKKREHYIKSNYDRAIKLWKKYLTQGHKDIAAYDCSGLGVKFLLNMKLISSDKTANGLYGLCTKISKSQLKKGDWVFKGSSLRKTHIGYVVDDTLNVIESRGRDYGVVKRAFSAGAWKYFGRPKVFKIEGGIIKGDDDVIKKGDKGEAVIAWQTSLKALGYDLGTYGANKDGIDGDFGSATEAATNKFKGAEGLKQDGIVDTATWGKMSVMLAKKSSINTAELQDTIKVLQGKISKAKAALG